MVAAMDVHDAVASRIVVVRLRCAELASKLEGEQIRAVVKYGQRGRSASCETGAFACKRRDGADGHILPVVAPFDSACVFLWDQRSDPLVRLRFVSVGCSEEVVADAEFTVRLFGTENEVILRSGSGLWRVPVGQISVRVDSQMLPVGEIRRGLQLTEACRPEDEPLVDNGASLCDGMHLQQKRQQQQLDGSLGAPLADCSEVLWAASRPSSKWPSSPLRPLVGMAALLGIA